MTDFQNKRQWHEEHIVEYILKNGYQVVARYDNGNEIVFAEVNIVDFLFLDMLLDATKGAKQ